MNGFKHYATNIFFFGLGSGYALYVSEGLMR